MKISFMVAAILAFILTACGTSTSSESTVVVDNNHEKDGEVLLSELDGTEINLRDYEGKVVFINFWATWCGPCIKEMPSIAELVEAYKDEDIVFLFASDEPVSKIEKFKEKKGYPFHYVQLKSSYEEMNMPVIPVTMILGKDGELKFKEAGMRDWASKSSKKLIDRTLNG